MRRLLVAPVPVRLRVRLCRGAAPSGQLARAGVAASRLRAFERSVEERPHPRLEQWLKAVARHAPGEERRRAGGGRGVAERRAEDALDRRERPGADHPPAARSPSSRFTRAVRRASRLGTQIRYSPTQIHAAAGARVRGGRRVARARVHRRWTRGSELDPDLRQLAVLVRAARAARRRQLHPAPRRDPAQRRRDAGAGGDGGARRGRAAVGRPRAVPDGDLGRPGDRSPPVGDPLGDRADAARLRRCRAAAITPAPGRDDMVRQWYRATAAWMQLREDHDKLHLDRARAIFPADPDILFLSACQRETYAGAPIQTRGALGRPADRRDAGRRIRAGGAARGGRSVPARARDQAGLCGSAAALRARAGRPRQTRGGGGRAAPRRGRPRRSADAVLRRAVSRRGRGGARQPRQRASSRTSRPPTSFRWRSRRCWR